MKLVLLLLVLTLALIATSEAQRRNGSRRASRDRQNRPRGSSRRRSRVVEGQRPKATKAENSLEWLKCEANLNEISRAAHIVTGRVEQFGVFTTQIQVKRVLKGGVIPGTVTVTSCQGSCCHLRRRDTRLFLLAEPEQSDGQEVYPQIAPPLRILLKTLDAITAAAKGT